MDKPWFDIELKPQVLRTMNRRQYYAARSWLRYLRRKVLLTGAFEFNMDESADS